MTKYAKCSVCGYVVAIKDDMDAGDYKCPVDGTTLVVATEADYYNAAMVKNRSSFGADDLYTPTDYGRNWENLGVIAAQQIFASDYFGNGIVIVGCDWPGHVWRTTDYGATWTDLGVIVGDPMYTIKSFGNGIGVIGVDDGHVWRTTDYGATWADLGDITGTASGLRAASSLGNGIAILSDDAFHIYRSINYGATWTNLGVIGTNVINALAYLGDGVAIAGDGSNHVFRSTNYGATWTDLSTITSSSIRTMEYVSNGIAIATGATKCYRSTDYGATWADLGIIAAGTIRSSKYLGNGVIITGDMAAHITRSKDFGLTWTDLGVIASGSIWTLTSTENGIAIIGDSTNRIYRSVPAFASANFNPNQFDKLFQFGCLGVITSNGTSYLAPGNGATQVNEITMRAPRPGILKNLYIQQRVASGAGGRTDIYTVRVNGADKTITCTLDNAIQGSDITHEVLVAAGDRISIKLVSNNAADTSADVVGTLELM